MRIKSKESESAALGVDVAAAILLAILAVSFFFIYKGSTKFDTDAFGCESKGGSCVAKGQCPTPGPSYTCPVKGQVCCIK